MPSLHTLTLLCLVACTGPTATLVDVDADTDADSDADSDTDSDTDSDADIVPTEDLYRFPAREDVAVDSVSYGGQIFRHVLIEDMKTHLGGLTARLDAGTFVPVSGQVRDELLFYVDFDSPSSGQVAHLQDTTPSTLQVTYDDLGSDKDLRGKLAGNDAIGQHRDWSTGFVGWNASSPEDLVLTWIDTIDAQSVAWAAGSYPLDPVGAPVSAVFLTSEGQDLQQLLQKFLTVGVAFSQGTDDYLDDDVADKGLNADHTAVEAGEPFTALEHAWDEGFGYFGASRSYGAWTDAEVSDSVKDVDSSGSIDLLSEKVFGHAANAAKRDAGAVVPTDFTDDAFRAFHEGRLLLSTTHGALDAADAATLAGHRDQAVLAWERAIAATIVHYINDVIIDLNAAPADYAFEDHAKHWSEMKGFALALQFNPRSPVSDAQFLDLHTTLGEAPVLQTAPLVVREAHIADLLTARAMLGTAYGFASENLGDADGTNGW